MPRQARSELTRSHLVEAAAEEFARHGYAGASLDRICRAGGVTKGALYFHFASKDEICRAVQNEACDLVAELVGKLATAERPALQSVIDLTHALVGWLQSEPTVRASLRLARAGDRRDPFLQHWCAAVDHFLRAADSPLADPPAVELQATLVTAVAVGLELVWWHRRDGVDLPRSLTEMWRMLLPALAGADATGFSPEGMWGSRFEDA
ncbi:ScbR family autoregulator-binding transcription factor [Actinokineospora sp. NBRC 105648]|uniref:ScbR family autoregulator-binding transcription factor n=1 Tax=Actinokineospora sp. NBRC 105648 TaxID=3032206 RepID=UPI00249FE03A|nr:ScbR family autoregulator-binding transcription factor [Actinokineospora sp. NBRC 105648]GLZ40009.1 TetR family transcriptional regulator [Actinokineospora sp. NBRC 105648]